MTTSRHSQRYAPWFLCAGIVLTGGLIVWLGILIFAPIFSHVDASEELKEQSLVPAYDYLPWRDLPVQDDRLKPFETACAETVRTISGRTKFEGHQPVAVVLAWMMQSGGEVPAGCTDWEHYPFILCNHRELRERIYRHRRKQGETLTRFQQTGKYVSPNDLRTSPGFDALLVEVSKLRGEDPQKAHFQMDDVQRKAEQLVRRLVLYDAVGGRLSTKLHQNAMVDQKLVLLDQAASIAGTNTQLALEAQLARLKRPSDPFLFVGLDRASASDWFSLGELRFIRRDPKKWQVYMQDRLAENPERYVSPQSQSVLREFQERLKAGRTAGILDETAQLLSDRRDARVAAFESAHHRGNQEEANRIFNQVLKLATPQKMQQVREKFAARIPDEKQALKAGSTTIQEILEQSHRQLLSRLQKELERTAGRRYRPDSLHFRMLNLYYLESRIQDFYRNSVTSQTCPLYEVDRVLDAYTRLQQAYLSGQQDRFATASQDFFQALRETTRSVKIQGVAQRNNNRQVAQEFDRLLAAQKSGDSQQIQRAYERYFAVAGEHGIEASGDAGRLRLELLLNRSRPFFWAWIAMFAAALIFLASLAMKPRMIYIAGFVCFFLSLAFQVFGFVGRIVIAGRAPVGNMYESVIWVALTSAILALVLEAIYRRKVIIFSGAIVAALGLIMADQLPLALDPKISPLAPMLRTNYWLTVHVLTIVSGYAAATLAWGLGNVSLALMTWGKGGSETLKVLSRFTYRAMQLTVLLLAVGTFLGGWWAAESWGRFWGWDPKEVGALIALICYVIPLHARYIGWVKEYGLALSAVICYGAIILSWYVVNFVLAAGLHSYGFGDSGGMLWVAWAAALNVQWVLVATWIFRAKTARDAFDVEERGKTA